jgi:hypothetical protein
MEGSRGVLAEDGACASRRASRQWVAQHAAVKESLKMTPKTKLWCDQARSAGLDHLSTRCKDLINIAWHAATRDMTDPVDIASVKASLMIDVSQDILRKPWTTHLGTFTTSAQLYSFRLERFLLEQEKFYLLGFPHSTDFTSLSTNALRDLSGDAMALPSVTMVTYSLLLIGKFPGLWSN